MAKRSTNPSTTRQSAARVRCAIYTRKSTEEGLDQQFNSLDAQREACAAYVLSQQHEGWTLLPDLYDDGGFSGGSMARPALQRLLDDVHAGRIDVIVVYKVDRLTRSLADFAKIVEVLDEAGASFVSVTQAFNTTNSMGRLTLNVLLSFAQFEREVTGERIRDKIAASKRKGMWMGGVVPLGYDVRDRRLVINEAEAAMVRLIFERHHERKTLRQLADDLARRGITSKVRRRRDGTIANGHTFTAGALRHILRNRLYIGEVSHRDQIYLGEHEAIIERRIWEQSQELLDRAVPRPRTGHVSALAGRLRDTDGRKLNAAHAIKGNKRYRYYVSATRESAGCWRLPAGDIEAMVVSAIGKLFDDPLRLVGETGIEPSPSRIADCAVRAASAGEDARSLQHLLDELDASIIVAETKLSVSIDREKLAAMLDIDLPVGYPVESVAIDVPVSLKRRGHELRLVYARPDDDSRKPDGKLVELVARGWVTWDQLSKGPGVSNSTRRSHLTRLARLRFLAPDIVTAILEGRQPVELTSRSLLRISDLPLGWDEQRRALGFG
jgi:DNA invertase Pin-like site-specific DNA recombinase